MAGKPSIVTTITARMTSSRFPGKVLADIGGRPSLARMVDRVRRAALHGTLVVATTTNGDDDPVADLCRNLDVAVFRGDEADVLGRVHGAVRESGAATVVRLTGDCPMIDPGLVDRAIESFLDGDWDYLSNNRTRSFPDGLDVEVFSARALDRAFREARHPHLREHVTPYIHGRRADLPHGDFRIGDLVHDPSLGHLRWTVDTRDDLDHVRLFFRDLGDAFTWVDALALERTLRGGVPEAAGPDHIHVQPKT